MPNKLVIINSSASEDFSMAIATHNISQTICCSNCGEFAERHYLLEQMLVRTQCSKCDYLMVSCQKTGKVIEAYAPGIAAVCSI
jgi:hypothetical protein